MKTIIGALFIAAIAGMLVVYPMYFMALNEFKKKLIELNMDALKMLPGHRSKIDLRVAYQAIEASREGHIGGIRLCDEVMSSRRKAVKFLYIGMALFMIVLAIGLTDSIFSK